MINCLVIDDEPLALGLIESYIMKIPFLNLIASTNDPLKTFPFFESHRIDLIFLDIQMPRITGIDFLKTLNPRPRVIFTTAHSEYALAGFELQAVDYLLKPIPFERFLAACNRAQEAINSGGKKEDKDYFFVNASHKIHKIAYDNIVYLEGLKDYTKIHLADSQHPLLVLQNLKHFEELLPADRFIRIHRSYIVPFSKLNTITRKQVTIGKTEIPVSDLYRDRLFTAIEM